MAGSLIFWTYLFCFYRGTSVTANDGVWHHICASWQSSSGSWKFYKDGVLKKEGTNLKRGHTIRSGGTLVLGQEQDSVGGGFDADQSFQGMISNVNMWNLVLTDDQVEKMSKSCLLEEASDRKVYKWLDFLREGLARMIKQSSCESFGMGMCQFNT